METCIGAHCTLIMASALRFKLLKQFFPFICECAEIKFSFLCSFSLIFFHSTPDCFSLLIAVFFFTFFYNYLVLSVHRHRISYANTWKFWFRSEKNFSSLFTLAAFFFLLSSGILWLWLNNDNAVAAQTTITPASVIDREKLKKGKHFFFVSRLQEKLSIL